MPGCLTGDQPDGNSQFDRLVASIRLETAGHWRRRAALIERRGGCCGPERRGFTAPILVRWFSLELANKHTGSVLRVSIFQRIIAIVAALALMGGMLLPLLPVQTTMSRTSDQGMTMECPSCHVAPDCSGVCLVMPEASLLHTTQLVQIPTRIQASLLSDSFKSTLAKPPPRPAAS